MLEKIWKCWETHAHVCEHLKKLGNLKMFGNIQTCWETCENVGNNMKTFGNIWFCLEASEHIGKHLTTLGNIWNCWDQSENVRNNMNMLGNIWTCLGPTVSQLCPNATLSTAPFATSTWSYHSLAKLRWEHQSSAVQLKPRFELNRLALRAHRGWHLPCKRRAIAVNKRQHVAEVWV